MRKIFGVLLTLLLVAFVATPAQAVSGSWSNPVVVSPTPFGNSFQVGLEIEADALGNLFSVWNQSDGTKQRVWISKSSDHGNTWSNPSPISPANQDSTQAVIAIDKANTIYVAWYGTDGSFDKIQTSKSSNAGTSWSTPVDLSSNTDLNRRPVIASYNTGTVTVAWRTIDSGVSSDILSSTTTNSGASWSPEVAASTSGNLIYNVSPSLSYSPTGVAFLTWVQEDSSQNVFAQISSMSGTTWASPTTLTGQGIASTPSVAFGASNTVISSWVYGDGNDLEVQTKSSADNGATWSAARSVATLNSQVCDCEAQVVSTPTGVSTIVFSFGEIVESSTSRDNGVTWSTPTLVSEQGGQSTYDISVVMDSNGNVAATWQDFSQGSQVNFVGVNTSEDNGATWDYPEGLSDQQFGAETPRVAVDSSGYLVVNWVQQTSVTPEFNVQSSNAFWATPSTPSPDNGGSSELARTGFDITLYITVILTILLGIGFIQLRRKA